MYKYTNKQFDKVDILTQYNNYNPKIDKNSRQITSHVSIDIFEETEKIEVDISSPDNMFVVLSSLAYAFNSIIQHYQLDQNTILKTFNDTVKELSKEPVTKSEISDDDIPFIDWVEPYDDTLDNDDTNQG